MTEADRLREPESEMLCRFLRFVRPFTDEANQIGNAVGYDALMDFEIDITNAMERAMELEGRQLEFGFTPKQWLAGITRRAGM